MCTLVLSHNKLNSFSREYVECASLTEPPYRRQTELALLHALAFRCIFSDLHSRSFYISFCSGVLTDKVCRADNTNLTSYTPYHIIAGSRPLSHALPHQSTSSTAVVIPRRLTAELRIIRRLYMCAIRKLRSSMPFGRSGHSYTPCHMVTERQEVDLITSCYDS